jgi:hypothetical protein
MVLKKSCCLYDFPLSEDYVRDKDWYDQHVTHRFIMQRITKNDQKVSREQDKRRREHRGYLQDNTQVLRTSLSVQPRRCFREHGLLSSDEPRSLLFAKNGSEKNDVLLALRCYGENLYITCTFCIQRFIDLGKELARESLPTSTVINFLCNFD